MHLFSYQQYHTEILINYHSTLQITKYHSQNAIIEYHSTLASQIMTRE
jgi:hypothetical protein